MARPRVSLEERFWARVNGPWSEGVGPEDCWEWAGRWRSKFGYGRIRRGGRESQQLQAHKVAWALTVGVEVNGQVVRHRCDNPLCCNPAHLELGSQADNIRDQFTHGRRR